jgi:PAS domain S-box-containing protein
MARPAGDALFEHAPCGLLLTDADGLILRANATFCAWLGYPAGGLAGRRLQDLLTVGGRLFHQTHCVPIMRLQGSLREVQLELVNHQGDRVPVLLNMVRQPGETGILHHVSVFLVTERRSYEQELLKARKASDAALAAKKEAQQQLTDANERLLHEAQRKNEFLATLAHELRNPLAPLRTGVHLLKLRHQSDAADLKVIAAFERQVDHLTRLTDDLLEVARITQDKLRLQREKVDLRAVVQAALDDCAELAQAQQHTVTLELAAQALTVEGDVARLTQIVVNVFSNACKYTPPGGHILVRARRGATDVELVIEDNGIGLNAQALPEIFTMFSQVESALDRSRGGLGVGLALVKRLLDLHGGAVEVYSAGPGLGSRFTIRLPASSGALTPGTEAPSAARVAARNRHTVLIVDDNADAAETLGAVLTLKGHSVSIANCAASALEIGAALRPDTALLDIGLPDMNGYQLAQHMRGSDWGAQALMVAITGWGTPQDQARAQAAGFNLHLTKPVNLPALLELLGG